MAITEEYESLVESLARRVAIYRKCAPWQHIGPVIKESLRVDAREIITEVTDFMESEIYPGLGLGGGKGALPDEPSPQEPSIDEPPFQPDTPKVPFGEVYVPDASEGSVKVSYPASNDDTAEPEPVEKVEKAEPVRRRPVTARGKRITRKRAAAKKAGK